MNRIVWTLPIWVWACIAAVIGNIALAHFGLPHVPGLLAILPWRSDEGDCDCEEDEDETEDKETKEAPGLPSMGAESGRLGN